MVSKNYKRVSSRIISCPTLQKYFLLNKIVSKIAKCLLWYYIVSWITKVFVLRLYRVQKLQTSFLWNFIVSTATKLFPPKLYRVHSHEIVSSETILCPKLQKCFLSRYIVSNTTNSFPPKWYRAQNTKMFPLKLNRVQI